MKQKSIFVYLSEKLHLYRVLFGMNPIAAWVLHVKLYICDVKFRITESSITDLL